MAWLRGRLDFRGLALTCSLLVTAADALVYGQPPQQFPAAEEQQERGLSSQQLDSLVSFIALYPDSLLAQVLEASTYPVQIVTAARWMQQNSDLKDKELVEASGKRDWDPSIQAMLAFPDVLRMMDQNLEWTNMLGNVFVAQRTDLMAAVQRMRTKAMQSGQLQSNAQQQVETTMVEGQPATMIQPADTQVMYVPSYDPRLVYGAAPDDYPYPKMIDPPGDAGATDAISFGTGVAVGAIFNGCCGAGWGWGWGLHWGAHPSLYVNNNFFNHNGNAFASRGNRGNVLLPGSQPAVSRPYAGVADQGQGFRHCR